MGHHRPADPAGPAAFRGCAPVLPTGASPWLLVLAVFVCELWLVISHGSCLGCYLEECLTKQCGVTTFRPLDNLKQCALPLELHS